MPAQLTDHLFSRFWPDSPHVNRRLVKVVASSVYFSKPRTKLYAEVEVSKYDWQALSVLPYSQNASTSINFEHCNAFVFVTYTLWQKWSQSRSFADAIMLLATLPQFIALVATTLELPGAATISSWIPIEMPVVADLLRILHHIVPVSASQ